MHWDGSAMCVESHPDHSQSALLNSCSYSRSFIAEPIAKSTSQSIERDDLSTVISDGLKQSLGGHRSGGGLLRLEQAIMQPRVIAELFTTAFRPNNSNAPIPPLAVINPMPAKSAQHDLSDRRSMCDLEKAEQQAGADHPEHEHHKAGNEQDQHDGKQQRQQQQQIDRRKAAERQQRRRGIAQAVMILPAAEPGFGAQFACQPPRIAECCRDTLLGPPRSARLLEISGVVSQDIIDVFCRKPGEPVPERAEDAMRFIWSLRGVGRRRR